MSLVTFTKLGRYGRAGNQLFQIAGVIGIAVKHNYNFGFPYWQNWDHRFPPDNIIKPSDEDIDMQSYFLRPLPCIDETMQFAIKDVEWGYHDIVLPPGLWDLRGHMQSEKYFLHCRELIQYFFAWGPKAIDNAPWQWMPQATPERPTCCIQFRRGDYVEKAGYHPVIGPDYYERAMSLMPAGTQFVVFPENNEAEAREIIGSNAEYVPTDIHYMLRMYMASQCTHFILPNSTFFWFPAWLGDHAGKIVTVPKNWFGPEADGLPATDIACEGWKVL